MLDLIQFAQAAPSSGWSAPQTLDTNVGGLQIEVAANSDGRLEVFAIDESFNVNHKWQTNQGTFSAYTPFGTTARQIAVGQNLDGRLEIFTVGVDYSIWHFWEASPSNGPWESGQITGQAKQIALGKNADGRLELFFIGLDDYIYHAWQNSPNATTLSQSKTNAQAIRIAVELDADDRMQLAYTSLTASPLTSTEVWSMTQLTAGSTTLSPSIGLRAFAKDLTFLKRADGLLELFCIDNANNILRIPKTGPSRGWMAPESFGGQAQQIRFFQDADTRYDMFYVGMDGYIYQLWQTTVDGAWGGGGRTGPPMLATFISGVRGANGCIAMFALGYLNPPNQTVAAPYGALGSWGNYCFYNNGRPLENVVVDINVTQDLVPTSSLSQYPGFSIQLNGNGPAGASIDWQQYSFEYDGSNINTCINNWEPNGSPTIVPPNKQVCAIAGNRLPAGTHLQVALTHGVNGNITAATFKVWNGAGTLLGNTTVLISDAPNYKPDLVAPILAYQVNIVGSYNGAHAWFSSGAGTITYNSSAATTAVSWDPTPAFPGDGNRLPPSVSFTLTDESADTNYSALNNTPAISAQQSFSTFVTPHVVPRKAPADVPRRAHQPSSEVLTHG